MYIPSIHSKGQGAVNHLKNVYCFRYCAEVNMNNSFGNAMTFPLYSVLPQEQLFVFTFVHYFQQRTFCRR